MLFKFGKRRENLKPYKDLNLGLFCFYSGMFYQLSRGELGPNTWPIHLAYILGLYSGARSAREALDRAAKNHTQKNSGNPSSRENLIAYEQVYVSIYIQIVLCE